MKAGLLPIASGYAAFKVNANFPDNRARHGLPTIQGAILLFDAATGSALALIDSLKDLESPLKKEAKEYLEGFFRQIEKPANVKKTFADGCKAQPTM